MIDRGSIVALALLTACARPAATPSASSSGASEAGPRSPRPSTDGSAELELVESWPLETTLDHADVRDAADVWPEMIDRAERTIDLAEFYASDADAGATRLTPVIQALERAVKRGVRVRFLADALFAPKYPATLARLGEIGATVKTIDGAKRFGGVQHAKYMVVDAEGVFVGSQNFDWRSLSHIHEIGLRIRSPQIAGSLLDVFETDWTLSEASAGAEARVHRALGRATARAQSGETLTLFASPKGWLPDESQWELPRIVELLDGASASVKLQVLLYSTQNRDKSEFTTLDEAVRRAAARGVPVQLLVSDWSAKAGSHARRSLEALAALPNVTVRVLTIPVASSGEIPFARIAHAKYLVVDGQSAWVGTSNWEGDYFLKSRDVSIIAKDGPLARRLGRVFDDGWASAYAAPFSR